METELFKYCLQLKEAGDDEKIEELGNIIANRHFMIKELNEIFNNKKLLRMLKNCYNLNLFPDIDNFNDNHLKPTTIVLKLIERLKA